MSQVKNRAAADVQITAEHILKVANASGIQKTFKRTEHEITDPEELAMVKLEKRKEFENRVRSNRDRVAVWVKYANWEARLGEFARARSIFERGLQVAHTDRSLWLKYAEMEMGNLLIGPEMYGINGNFTACGTVLVQVCFYGGDRWGCGLRPQNF